MADGLGRMNDMVKHFGFELGRKSQPEYEHHDIFFLPWLGVRRSKAVIVKWKVADKDIELRALGPTLYAV